MDDVPDLTTGVTTWGLRGVEGERAGNDTTRSATQVCRRHLESCLGGHEEGVLGVDEGVKNASPSILQWGRTALSDCATFSVFWGV